MKNVYEECPKFENERWLLRFVEKSDSEDFANESGVLRLDVGSAYEKSEVLKEIMSLIVPHIFEMFDCKQVVTKVPVYAVERKAAAEAFGFEKTDSLLVAKDGVAFNGYWIFKK